MSSFWGTFQSPPKQEQAEDKNYQIPNQKTDKTKTLKEANLQLKSLTTRINIVKIIIFRIISCAVGVLIASGSLHWLLRLVCKEEKKFEVTLKIVSIVGLISLGLELSQVFSLAYLPSLFLPLTLLKAFGVIVNIGIYFYLFSKWHNTSLGQNIKIFLILLVFAVILGIILVIGMIIFMFFLFATRGGGLLM